MTHGRKRVIVIGGGITGLAAGYRLMREAENRNILLEVALLEASDRVGGVIQTTHKDEFLIEHGPDAFISTKPWAKNLCEELGIEDKLIGTNPKVRRSFVTRNGILHPVPEGFYMMAPGALLPFLKSPIFSWWGKLRMGLDLLISRRGNDTDESVADFVRRRLGTEAFERMAQPMIGGIYTSDAENLSLKATFPRFLEMEKAHGSIIKALWAQKRKSRQTATSGLTRDTSGPRYGLFLALAYGMQTLTDTLAQILSGCIRLHARVATIQQTENEVRWRVSLEDGKIQEAELLCIALPAPQAGKILAEISPTLAKRLTSIPYASSATVNMAFRREDVTHPLNGMGFVVPATEQRTLIGCSFSSVKFENRAPAEHVLLRAFVEETNNANQNKLTESALTDVGKLLGIKKEPLFSIVSQHSQAMAQYLVGHQELVTEIEELAKSLPGLALAGNAYHGIGIPDCIHSGEQAALALLDSL